MDGAVSGEPVHVVAAVVQRSGKYLICRRPARKRHGGLWEFPGGKLQECEDLVHAAQRELAEELGITVVALGRTLLSLRDVDSPFLIHFVEAETEGEPLALEHEALAWVSPGEFAAYPLAPSDRIFSQRIA